MLKTFFPLYRRIMQRNFRLRAGLFMACWFLLNMQLAVAALHDMRIHSSSFKPQSSQRSYNDMDAPYSGDSKLQPLCNKHCNPDNGQVFSPGLQLVAMSAESSLLPVEQMQMTTFDHKAWYFPPVNAPPAEIRFCRFRE